jgi:hypothetical protein
MAVLPAMVVEMVNPDFNPLQSSHQDHRMAIIPLQALMLLSTTCLDVTLSRRHHHQLKHRGFLPPMVILQHPPMNMLVPKLKLYGSHKKPMTMFFTRTKTLLVYLMHISILRLVMISPSPRLCHLHSVVDHMS